MIQGITRGRAGRGLLLAATGIAVALAATGLVPARAMAQASLAQTQPAAPAKAFAIPAQPLVSALARFTEISGVQFFFDAAIARNVQSPGVNGSFTPDAALQLLLAGTGLTYRFTNPTTVTLIEAPKSGAAVLPPVAVEGRLAQSDSAHVMPPYAGGQVATGGQLGFLGSRSVLDTPFNQTSYTAQVIQDQQARKLDDVLANDPSVRPNSPRAYGFDFVSIRGFDVASTAYGINGLYGIASNFSFLSLGAVERVEALKGPGTLMNGMPPSGGVGGSVNLVTKRATDAPITQLTTSWESDSQIGTHVDVGRRYGQNNEFGVRFNGIYRTGDTELANQSQELSTASLGFDIRGERVRLSLDAGYENNNTNAMTRYVSFNNSLTGLVPTAPDAKAAFMPKWGYWNSDSKLIMAQGEVDLTDSLTAYAQIGNVNSEAKYLYSDALQTTGAGNFNGSPRLNSQERDQTAMQSGFRATLDTGPVSHLVNVNAATSSSQTKIVNTTGTAFTSNLYNPISTATPTITVGGPFKTGSTDLSSFGIANTMSILDERVQFTAGIRKQYADVDGFSVATQTSAYETDAWTPGYALVVKPWQNVAFYANYVQGLESGSVVGTTFANAGEVLPPYETQQKEAGVKVDWGKLTTTVSAFEISKPLLITVPGNMQKQDGERLHRGTEVNVFGEVTDDLRILGGVMYLDARQEKTQNGTNQGKRVFGVSDVQINIGAEWDVPFIAPGLTLTGRAIHNSDFYANAANTQIVKEWTRYDVGARYELQSPWNDKPVVIRFTIENLLDSNYWQGANTDQYVFLGAPRTYLVSTTFNF